MKPMPHDSNRERPERSRLHLLSALAASTLLPQPARAGAALRRVGIIGGGMAGIACAWLLDGAADVVLFEARAAIGGNVQTVEVTLPGGANVPVDVGPQFFHPGPFPTYVQLLETLGFDPVPASTGGDARAFAASITLTAAGDAQPRFVSPIVPGRTWPLLPAWNRAGIEAFNTTLRAAQRREALDAPYGLTLDEWLPTLGLSQAQWEGIVLPWAASLYSGDIETARGYSARAAMVFAAKALPDNPLDGIEYLVLNAGMIEPLRRMAAQFSTVQVLLNAPVGGVQRRNGGGFTLHSAGGAQTDVDDLVFAASGPPTLALLQGVTGTAPQAAALAGIAFEPARLMLHTDATYAPARPAWTSFLNCGVDGAFCEASMSMQAALGTPGLWKSWVTNRSALPSQLLADVQFQHLVPTPASIQAQSALRLLQGLGGIWFAGGYLWPYDSQETALRSAIDVVEGMGSAGVRLRITPTKEHGP